MGVGTSLTWAVDQTLLPVRVWLRETILEWGALAPPKAAKAALAAHLGGCGGMPAQENFENLVLRYII